MVKKPKLHELVASKQVLKKWYLTAKNRNKRSAMDQTKQIYDMLEYFESVTNWKEFE